MFPSAAGKPVNLDALVAEVIVLAVTKVGITRHGGHAFGRGLATNPHQLGVPDKTIQRILLHSNVAVALGCYLNTAVSDAAAAMRRFERSLSNMHLTCTLRVQQVRRDRKWCDRSKRNVR
jgi:hypothetical protein